MAAFLTGSQAIAFAVATCKDERYRFVQQILMRFAYLRLKRHEKGIVIRFLMKVTGYSRQQLTRMIKRYRVYRTLARHQKTTNGFERHYTREDVMLLAELDKRHDTLVLRSCVNAPITSFVRPNTNGLPVFQSRTYTICGPLRSIKNIGAILLKPNPLKKHLLVNEANRVLRVNRVLSVSIPSIRVI